MKKYPIKFDYCEYQKGTDLKVNRSKLRKYNVSFFYPKLKVKSFELLVKKINQDLEPANHKNHFIVLH